MGKKKEILELLTKAVSTLYAIDNKSSLGERRRNVLVVDHLINKAAMLLTEGKKKRMPIHLIKLESESFLDYDVTEIGFLFPDGSVKMMPFKKGTKYRDLMNNTKK